MVGSCSWRQLLTRNEVFITTIKEEKPRGTSFLANNCFFLADRITARRALEDIHARPVCPNCSPVTPRYPAKTCARPRMLLVLTWEQWWPQSLICKGPSQLSLPCSHSGDRNYGYLFLSGPFLSISHSRMLSSQKLSCISEVLLFCLLSKTQVQLKIKAHIFTWKIIILSD